MTDVTLSLSTLPQLDAGNAATMIDNEIARAVSDLDQRGQDFKVRKVVINVDMWIDKKSEETRIVCKAQAKLPPRETREVPATTRKERGVARLLFDDLEGDGAGETGETADGGDAA